LSYRWFFLIFLLVYNASPSALAQFEFKLNKGLAAYLKKDYQGAIKPLEDALAENPQSATANHLLGLSLLRLNRYSESIKYLERAKSLDPNIKGIHLDLGTAYLGKGDLPRALSEFKEAVREAPESGIAYYNLGYTEFMLKDYKGAIDALGRASKLDPDLALQSHFYAGLSRYRLADYKNARADFELARRLGYRTDTGAAAQEYLDAILRLSKRYYGAVSSGIQYDTNVVLNPDGVNIVSNQKAARAVFSLNLGYKPYLTPDTQIGGDFTSYFSFNNDLQTYNVQNHRISLYGERKTSWGKTPLAFSLNFIYDLVLINGSPAHDLFSQSYSVIPTVSAEITSYTSTQFSYAFQYDNFKNFPERDAANNNFIIAQAFNLYNGRLYLRPGFNIAINSARDVQGKPNYDYVSPEFFIDAVALLPFGVMSYVSFYYYNQNYFNDSSNRVDNQFNVLVVVSKRLYKLLFLDLGYQHISNLSSNNIPPPNPYQYSRNIFSAALRVSF
jgi:tetratricopeptide (TPR) repeat protein